MPDPAAPVRILFLDVDGTLTDGVIGFTRDQDFRHFWVRDGLALEWARPGDAIVLLIHSSAARVKVLEMLRSRSAN